MDTVYGKTICGNCDNLLQHPFFDPENDLESSTVSCSKQECGKVLHNWCRLSTQKGSVGFYHWCCKHAPLEATLDYQVSFPERKPH
jgi:hypothetical protein